MKLLKLKSGKLIDKVTWGPYHVLPSEKIGQSIGIAYDDNTAIGFMGLNLKSRGGFEISNERKIWKCCQEN